MKINLKQELKTLDGVPLNEGKADGSVYNLTVGKALANILLAVKEGGRMKSFVLATDLWKKGEIELDSADFALLNKAVENTEIYTNIVTGQLLSIFEDLKQTKTDKKTK